MIAASRLALIAPVLLASWSASALELGLPVQCAIGTECFVQQLPDVQPGPDRKDPFCGMATYEGHDGTDIRLLSMKDVERGVPVFAMADGTVLQTRDGVEDKLVKTKQEAAAISRIGCGNAVFMDNGDGSLMIYLDALPLSRTLLIRERPDTKSLPPLPSAMTSPVRIGPNEA